MSLIKFEHGGPTYDAKYPEGIPSSIDITLSGKSDIYMQMVKPYLAVL